MRASSSWEKIILKIFPYLEKSKMTKITNIRFSFISLFLQYTSKLDLINCGHQSTCDRIKIHAFLSCKLTRHVHLPNSRREKLMCVFLFSRYRPWKENFACKIAHAFAEHQLTTNMAAILKPPRETWRHVPLCFIGQKRTLPRNPNWRGKNQFEKSFVYVWEHDSLEGLLRLLLSKIKLHFKY